MADSKRGGMNLKPCKPHGMFNAEKCIRYLRWVGVEVSDEMAQQWLDAQSAHRFLTSMKGAARRGADMWCENGHQVYVEHRRGQRTKKFHQTPPCAVCGARFAVWSLRFVEARDGSIRDYRPKDERWKALDWQPPPLGNDPPQTPFV